MKMKKILINTGYMLLATYIAILAGCAEQEFIDYGERIYVGKVDSLVVHGGFNRAQIVGQMFFAKSAVYCVIRWTSSTNANMDSIVVQSSNWRATDTMKVIINGLEDAAYRFYVQTYDSDGNSSLREECSGYAYGETFLSLATAKTINQMTVTGGGISLIWNSSEKAVSVEVAYETNAGTTKSLILPGNVFETILDDYKPGGNIKYRTGFLPEEDAIDILYSNWIDNVFR
jgi:hypothetical protein